jgi:hypothetical protein
VIFLLYREMYRNIKGYAGMIKTLCSFVLFQIFSFSNLVSLTKTLYLDLYYTFLF